MNKFKTWKSTKHVNPTTDYSYLPGQKPDVFNTFCFSPHIAQIPEYIQDTFSWILVELLPCSGTLVYLMESVFKMLLGIDSSSS